MHYIQNFGKSQEDDTIPRDVKVKQVKTNVCAIGDAIEKIINDNVNKIDEQDLKRNLWHYVHLKAHTNGSGDQLETMYKRVSAKTSAQAPTPVATVHAAQSHNKKKSLRFKSSSNCWL